jgi:GTP-binding protein HflX
VGFISDLPTQLVAAFRATLEEVLEADVLLHVRDISHPDSDAQKEDVLGVLSELGVAPEAQETMIEVWNKIDLLPDAQRLIIGERPAGAREVPVSSITGEGVDQLLTRIDDALRRNYVDATLRIDPGDGAGLAWAYSHGDVARREDMEDGSVRLEISVSTRAYSGFQRRFGARLKTSKA